MLVANALRLPYASGSAHMVATSPPYAYKRRYAGVEPCEWPAVTYRPMPGLPKVAIPKVTAEQIAETDEQRLWRSARAECVAEIAAGRLGPEFLAGLDKRRPPNTPEQLAGILGLEPDPLAYIGHLVLIFREARRVLRDDGLLAVNIGDSYANDAKWGGYSGGKHAGGMHGRTGAGRTETKPATGYPPKCLMGIPWRLAFALLADGWTLRSRMPGGVETDLVPDAVGLRPDVIWTKNAMPESVRDRPSVDFEDVFLFSKGKRYFFDQENGRTAYVPSDGAAHSGGFQGQEALKPRGPGGVERFYGAGGANMRASWRINTEPTSAEHYAAFPRELVRRLIKVGTSDKGCCPECGAPWVRVVKRTRFGRSQDRHYAGESGHTNPSGKVPGSNTRGMPNPMVRALGWRPSCDCSDGIHRPIDGELMDCFEPVPCTVVDPFSGIGRTGEVCAELGRRYAPAELSLGYAVIQNERLVKPRALGRGDIETALAASEAPCGTLPLFGG